MMKGPPLARLVDRLTEIPGIFLAEPAGSGTSKGKQTVVVKAVVNDLVNDIDGGFPSQELLDPFTAKINPEIRNWLGIVLILAHLLHDEFFIEQKGLGESVIAYLSSDKIRKLADLSDFREFVTDNDKREELTRLSLDALGFLPEGEAEKLAKDRLKTLDSVERKRILEKTRLAQERADEIRREMARREAEEAASKMSRE
jgi:hypothetical protein